VYGEIKRRRTKAYVVIKHEKGSRQQKIVGGRGLQFYTFFGISIGIKRRLIDIAKKITFYFLQNV
jgi:hypothetical protein